MGVKELREEVLPAESVEHSVKAMASIRNFPEEDRNSFRVARHLTTIANWTLAFHNGLSAKDRNRCAEP
jgi:hypothetical protein